MHPPPHQLLHYFHLALLLLLLSLLYFISCFPSFLDKATKTRWPQMSTCTSPSCPQISPRTQFKFCVHSKHTQRKRRTPQCPKLDTVGFRPGLTPSNLLDLFERKCVTPVDVLTASRRHFFQFPPPRSRGNNFPHHSTAARRSAEPQYAIYFTIWYILLT